MLELLFKPWFVSLIVGISTIVLHWNNDIGLTENVKRGMHVTLMCMLAIYVVCEYKNKPIQNIDITVPNNQQGGYNSVIGGADLVSALRNNAYGGHATSGLIMDPISNDLNLPLPPVPKF